MKNIYKKTGLAVAAAGVLFGWVACTDPIEISPDTDSSALTEAAGLYAWIDVIDNPRMKTVEVRTEPLAMELQVSMSREHNAIASFSIEPDLSQDLVDQYNTAHATDFLALPETALVLEDDGIMMIAPGERKSYEFSLTVDPRGVDEGTYLLPVKFSSTTEDVTVQDRDAVKYFIVKLLGDMPSTAKETGIISIAYIEVNGFNPLNAGEWVMASSGKQFFDIVNIFAANIKFDSETGSVYLSLNSNVQHILDNRDKYIKPLQDKGMKVCLTVLPDHDGVGFANLPDEDIARFATEIKAVVEAYGLDGVDFDDEYAEYTSHDIPGFVYPASSVPFGKLMYEVKRIMPDKLLTLYFIGSATEGFFSDIDGMQPGEFIDYAYYAQYGSWLDVSEWIKGMGRRQCGPYSWDMNDPGADWMMTDQVRSGGYGVQVCYDLRAENDPNVPDGNYEEILGIISQDIYSEGVVHTGINHAKDW